MSRYLFLTTSVLLAAAAAPAQGALFSFASDIDHTSWTFAGGAASVRDAQDPFDPQIILVDDNNGPLTPLPFSVEFEANFRIRHLASVPLGGGAFIHNYELNGVFGFLDAQSGAPLLTCSVTAGALTAIGGEFSWFTTSTLQVNDNPFGGSVVYTWFGPDLPAYDLLAGMSSGPDDMSFTLTAINHDGGTGVPLGMDRLPSSPWQSEGSYSGSAHFIPSPPAAGVLALAGIGLRRRRREN